MDVFTIPTHGSVAAMPRCLLLTWLLALGWSAHAASTSNADDITPTNLQNYGLSMLMDADRDRRGLDAADGLWSSVSRLQSQPRGTLSLQATVAHHSYWRVGQIGTVESAPNVRFGVDAGVYHGHRHAQDAETLQPQPSAGGHQLGGNFLWANAPRGQENQYASMTLALARVSLRSTLPDATLNAAEAALGYGRVFRAAISTNASVQWVPNVKIAASFICREGHQSSVQRCRRAAATQWESRLTWVERGVGVSVQPFFNLAYRSGGRDGIEEMSDATARQGVSYAFGAEVVGDSGLAVRGTLDVARRYSASEFGGGVEVHHRW